MSECLITKLKGPVNNDLIAKDGEIIFKVEGEAGSTIVASYAPTGSSDIRLPLLKGNVTIKDTQSNLGYEKSDDNPVYLVIPDKYNLDRFVIKSAKIETIDLNYFNPKIWCSITSSVDMRVKGVAIESPVRVNFAVRSSGNLYLEGVPVTFGKDGQLTITAVNKIICDAPLDFSGQDLSYIYYYSNVKLPEERNKVIFNYCVYNRIEGADITFKGGDKSKVSELFVKNSVCPSQDLSQFPKLKFITNQYKNNTLINPYCHTYGTGEGSQYFIAAEDIRMKSAEDVDRLLIANAGKPFTNSDPWYKIVRLHSAYGRTSASDDAVAQIVEAGGSVYIQSDPLIPTPQSASLTSRMVKVADPNPYKIYYKGTELLFNPEEQPTEVHVPSDWSMEAFDTLENAKKFVEDNNLKLTMSE